MGISKIQNVWYPTINNIIQINKKAIEFKTKKKEQHKVLNSKKIEEFVLELQNFSGSIEDKAAFIILKMSPANFHAFSQGNRRTAYMLANLFLWKNKCYMIAKKRFKTEEMFKEIRRKDFTIRDISNWLFKEKFKTNN